MFIGDQGLDAHSGYGAAAKPPITRLREIQDPQKTSTRTRRQSRRLVLFQQRLYVAAAEDQDQHRGVEGRERRRAEGDEG